MWVVHFLVLQINFSESKWTCLLDPNWEIVILPQAACVYACICISCWRYLCTNRIYKKTDLLFLSCRIFSARAFLPFFLFTLCCHGWTSFTDLLLVLLQLLLLASRIFFLAGPFLISGLPVASTSQRTTHTRVI